MIKVIKDHLGNTFASISALCKHYKIPYDAFRFRLAAGMKIEEAILKPFQDHGDIKPRKNLLIDHTGRKFRTYAELADAWGVTDVKRLKSRIQTGWNIEKALTTKVIKYTSRSEIYIDAKGREFKSMAAVARAYNLSYHSVAKCLRNGGKIEDVKRSDRRYFGIYSKDHTGQTFDSLQAMAAAWKIAATTLTSRLNAGWDMEKALTTPVNLAKCGQPISDHLGTRYASIEKMCAAYNISYPLYHYRRQKGWTVEKALTTPVNPLFKNRDIE